MQDIKFKVFYEPSGKIHDVLAIDFIKKNVTIEYKKGKTQVVCMEFCKIMQYTGMSDHNGNEIYSGHIVKFEPSLPYSIDECMIKNGEIGIIKFSEGKFIVSIVKSDVLFFNLDTIGDWVVIGNIYATPDLLE
ncbi:YopX family protein [Campylobacter sp. RM9328]|uniref:YopX family protein n=1 Tax=Campylobacter sp. RM9328 TaxID=1705720 RepID=UPI0014740FCB|nr:YopX family protein [Campylobacter sp. RM9328]